ncbi:hypothetical protein KVR01_013137 [Diaporthe batatas]|uniref:uncharacterized protein n=1 Tax=Diaporthe batatas TaxID=748121 RepID=UPI001D047398|nr:uncharacterized protein KVR01_013137 [Diaporthe batatas]KAG8156915.1 hypothetical protein KVR01_013137 [Diaporthe batatas]
MSSTATLSGSTLLLVAMVRPVCVWVEGRLLRVQVPPMFQRPKGTSSSKITTLQFELFAHALRHPPDHRPQAHPSPPSDTFSILFIDLTMASEGVVDLLKLPLEKRSESLRARWPQPLDGSLTGHEGRDWTVGEKAAIDTAVLIIRAINAHCDPLDPALGLEESAVEARRKAEEKTHLLRYSWYTTPYSRPYEVADAVLKLQRHVCRKVLRGNAKITFERLIESSVLADAFWSRPEFLAWSLTENVRHEGAGWTMQKMTCIPAGKDQPLADESAVPEVLAKRSLIKWKWDGRTQLAEFFGTKFKLEWSSADGNVHHQGIRACPRCLRVRYDPGGRDDAPGFTELARMAMDDPIQGEVVCYRLLATVKLGSTGCDFVRVYDSDIRDAQPMAARTLALPHVDSDWQLGQPGSRFMLYYISCDAEVEPDFDPEEIVVVSRREIELLGHLNAASQSIISGAPEPEAYGYTTVSEPSGSQDGALELYRKGQASGRDPRAVTRERVREQGGDLDLLYGAGHRP